MMPDSRLFNTFRFRLPFLLALILIVTSISFGAYRSHMEHGNSVAQQKRMVMAILDTMAASVGAALFRHDISMIESRIATLDHFADVRSVIVYSPDWRILVEESRDRDRKLVPTYRYARQSSRLSPEKTCEDNSTLYCLKKIQFAGTHLGWIELDYDLDHIHAHKNQDLVTSIAQGFVTIALSLALLMLYLRGRVRDLGKASNFAGTIHLNPGSRLVIESGESELKELVTALNETSVLLEKRDMQARKTTEDLRTRNNRLACLYNITGLLDNNLYDLTAKLRQVADRVQEALGNGKQYRVELHVYPEIADDSGAKNKIRDNFVHVGHVSISLLNNRADTIGQQEASLEEKLFLMEIAHKLSDYLSQCDLPRNLVIKSSV